MKERKARFLGGVMVACLVVGAGCGESFEGGERPDLSDLDYRYRVPTATFDEELAVRLLDDYVVRRQRVRRTGNFEEMTTAVDQLAAATDRDDEGTITVDDMPIQADATMTLSGACGGWRDDTGERGTFSLRAVIEESVFVPMLWGQVDGCRSQVELEGEEIRSEFSGQAALYVPNLIDATGGEAMTILFAFSLADVEIDGQRIGTWSDSVRFIGGVVEMIAEDSAGNHVVIAGNPVAGEISIRAANGIFRCSVQERQCASEQPSAPQFSY